MVAAFVVSGAASLSVSETTTLISAPPTAPHQDAQSAEAAITPDGRFIAFSSAATNLRSGIFVRDLDARKTSVVSVSATGEPAENQSFDPSIARHGTAIAFESAAANLSLRDTTQCARSPMRQDDCMDVFVRSGLEILPPPPPLPGPPPPLPLPPPPTVVPPPPPADNGTAPRRCRAPRLRGKTLASARRAAARANCRLGSVRRTRTTRIRAGRIVRQSPRPGALLRPRGRINVTVSARR